MENESIYPQIEFKDKNLVLTKVIKAGKRIYYFDVKRNSKEELFLSITESKKIYPSADSQSYQIERHKVFLYKEDFEKFRDALSEVINYMTIENEKSGFNVGLESLDVKE